MNPALPAPEPPVQAAAPQTPSNLPQSWPRSAQLSLAFLLGVAVTLIGMMLVQSVRWNGQPAVLQAAPSTSTSPPAPSPTHQRPPVSPDLSADTSTLHAPVKGKTLAAEGSIDVNAATKEQLMTLPGIGPALAQRIIDERNKRQFRSVNDLDHVPGIGPKTVAKLQPYVTFGAVTASGPKLPE